jgi:hypothetical protein
MRRVAVLAVLTALAAVTAGCGGTRPLPPATSVDGPGFLLAPGWHTLGDGLAQPPNAPDASAANVPFVAADRSQSAPFRTEASLPRRGILIWAQLQARWPPVDRRFPVRRPPLQVGEAASSPGIEGFQPTGSIRRVQARFAGYDVDVSIFFGARHPSPAAVAAANDELARLSFPACPAALPVEAGDPSAAARATLEWLRTSLVRGFKHALRGAQASGTIVSPGSRDARVQIVRRLCGKASARLVAVRVYPTRLGASELGAELLYFLAKTPRGWLVWRQG